MIDDATLAKWKQECRENWMGTVTERLLAALQEIRRLREIERAVWSRGLEADGQTMATLTLENQRLKAVPDARRAMVQELATWINNVATDSQLDVPVPALDGKTGRALVAAVRK